MSLAGSADERIALHKQIVRANVEFYRQIAPTYDDYESCVADPFSQEGLEVDLTWIAGTLPPGPVRCLDCGAGTGNLTLKMLRRGWRVTVVDVSLDMLNIMRHKADALRYPLEAVNDSIESFLARTEETFQVISFSSVLHHLYSPAGVAAQAAKRIQPGGIFYSNFDPVRPRHPHLAGAILDFDTVLAKTLYDPGDLLPGIWRRTRKLFSSPDELAGRPIASAGDLAEFHAREGLDFDQIAGALQGEGLEVKVEVYPQGRTKLVRGINRKLRACQSFKIFAQRLSSAGAKRIVSSWATDPASGRPAQGNRIK